MSQDDDARRQAEINMFAKLASGETFQYMTEPEDKSSPVDSKAMFAAAVQQEDMGAGTFCMSSSPNVHKALASSNLDAAVAALTSGDEDYEPSEREESPVEELNFRRGPGRAPAEPTPMYNEKVLLPRPLFYGPILPPRVIKEAREAVADAMKDMNLDLSQRPRLSQLPPHVRNVVGAVQAFGYGIPIFPCDVKDEHSYRGSEYVSTFQPVWGDVARAERERLMAIYRATLPDEPPPAEETTREESVKATGAGQGTSGEGSAVDVLQVLANADEPHIGVSSSFPEKGSPKKISKSLLLRSKSAPVVGGKRPPPAAMSDKDQFLQWARGKPISPARHVAKQNDAVKMSPSEEKELFSQWARGNSDSPELDVVKVRSATAPGDKDLFSKWAQGDADQSPGVTQNRKAGEDSDVAIFSKWAQSGADESPAALYSDDDELKEIDQASNEEIASVLEKNQFAKWAQGGSQARTPPPTADKNTESEAISEQNQFAQWAQGCSPANIPPVAEDKEASESGSAQQEEKDLFAKWASGGSSHPSRSSPESGGSDQGNSSESIEDKSAPPSEQDTFSQWARAGQDGTGVSSTIASNSTQQPFDTFHAIPDTTVDEYSDDDSVDRSEMKKKVGMNENLNLALASLANDDTGRSMPVGTESIGEDEANALLAQIGATTEGGRPLTNLEITNGLVPLFGCDDSPLPSESDLGLFQTKEEQMRSMEQRRSQEIIDKHTYPNIFGPVVCPNPAQGPDDSHSWNSRSLPSRKHGTPHGMTGHQTSGPGIVPVLDSSPAKPKKKQSSGKQSPAPVEGPAPDKKERSRSFDTGTPSAYSSSSRSHDTMKSTSRSHRKNSSRGFTSFDANARFGWWNVPSGEGAACNDFDEDEPDLLQLPHQESGSSTTEVATGLTPTSKFLRKENMPLSELHSATSVASALPFLSDRPPSFRYLQIDTEAVGFPALGGEIEPLFCSLAIYHVESTTSSHDPRAAPVPNMLRCGRVTEVLNFDVVRDPSIEAACSPSLWPYATIVDKNGSSMPPSPPEQATQGSRCGVFPLASNLNVSNLYAILIVHKILSDNEDVEVYTKPLKSDSKGKSLPSGIDIKKLREKAARASGRHGHLLTPFAFGVAPLLQIFGTDIPTSVNSRAVQIPLFRFINGYGDRPIIDHIMVMLYPRADHRSSGIGGPAPLTNSGTAMLVMRNFGYLGLHQAVFSRSSLRARDRLVDFSGEMQVRREVSRCDDAEEEDSPRINDDRTYVVAPWHKEYVSEPAVNGGRNCVSANVEGDSQAGQGRQPEERQPEENASDINRTRDKSTSRLYAKEMAPVPLKLMPSTGTGKSSAANAGRSRSLRNGRSALRELDIEPTFHTTFCNELLCHPRLLHKSPKGKIAIKVELREIEWSVIRQTYLAHTPKYGPCLHNPRRGPFLVQDAFTACSFQAVNAHFLDEFKFKLPLLLESKFIGGGLKSGPLALLFSVYQADLKPKRNWNVAAPRRSHARQDPNDAGSARKKSMPRMLACGFLPITTSDTSCLIDNGLHDVKLMYTSERFEDGEKGRDTLILSQLTEPKSREGTYITGHVMSSSADEDERHTLTDTDGSFFGSETASESDVARSETSSGAGLVRSNAKRDPMGLQVRIVVHSSVHPQNATLNEFLSRLPDAPTPLPKAVLSPSSPWKLRRQELLKHIATAEMETHLHGPSDEMQKLLMFTIDLSKPSLCSTADSSSHFLRIFGQLVRTLVSGSGTPSLLWANPACVIPLRMHTFATLLQIVNGVNTYMVRNGCTQLDGKSRWNLTQLSRVIAMAFDEEQLFTNFDESAGEILTANEWKGMFIDPTYSRSTEIEGDDEAISERRSHRCGPSKKRDVVDGEGADTSVEDESIGELLAALASTDGSEPYHDEASNSESPPPANSESPPPAKNAVESTTDFKIDSKADFQSNLWAGLAESSPESTSVGGSIAAQNMIRAYGGVGPSNRRKWMTAPTSGGLATIQEDSDQAECDFNDSTTDLGAVVTSISPERPGEVNAVDTELVLREPVAERKKMRVPRITKKDGEEEAPKPKPKPATFDSHAFSKLTVPSTDEEIFTAGTAFLDAIGKNLGLSSAASKAMGGEEQRVGQAHHRKTRSRCSIDWTIPDIDVMGNRDSFEQQPSNDQVKFDPSSKMQREQVKSTVRNSSGPPRTTMVSLIEEESNTVSLPSYLDRLVTLGKVGGGGRWCPYAYEVIIIQWVALLVDQRRSVEKPRDGRRASPHPADFESSEYPQGTFLGASEGLSDAAMRARGVAIACTPVLLEIVKKSIGWRVHHLHDKAKKAESSYSRRCPPLVCLDEFLLTHLEQLVSIITDACLDSRNFDSWEFRQTCIDVNDSIIRFLRDMFAFLHTGQVYRLILVYLSRFVVRDGKLRQDRDSKIGLRCSWEISKLRLNAITTLVRFPDFIRVNSPEMQNWGQWTMQVPPQLALDFFSTALKQLKSFALPEFSSTESHGETSSLSLPSLQPHWLAEVVTDICLSGTEHAEQYIQHRAGSLLNELFWSHSQEGRANGTSAAVATMYVPFLRKVLGYTSYLASMPAKHQLRKDVIPCATFVMQCAPDGIMRALWRELCIQAEGKGLNEKYGGVLDLEQAGFRNEASVNELVFQASAEEEEKTDPDIFDMFGLLNLALSTFEYEGSEEDLDAENIVDCNDLLAIWRKEFSLALVEPGDAKTSFLGQGRMMHCRRQENVDTRQGKTYSTTSSRKWNAHNASLAIIHTSRLMVREMVGMQRSGTGDVENQDSGSNGASSSESAKPKHQLNFSSVDIIIFVRAAASVYLHSLSLRQSDIVIVKTLDAAVEIVKIFGIKIFLRAVGETLQHWMRLVSFHCGARRAEVRVQALEFLWLVLRLTWDSYGSFFRIRVPLLSVQTEVMERIVATATSRNYREQRRMGFPLQSLPNDCAEASLSPLWRTLDRLHHQSASQNLAFRSALIRLAESMKKLYRAYIAAHALAIVNRALSPLSPTNSTFEMDFQDESSAYFQSRRIVVHRIINASAGYSKQFLGLQRSYSELANVAHNEAVEDAFLDAANVFAPTELPTNRVAWLNRLAKFHASRKKYAEEATCHFHIHVTLRQAARLHHSLWANIPFVAWTVNAADGLHLEGEGPAGEPEDYYDVDFDLEELTVEDPGIFENSLGKQIDKRNSFRRQFYRVANSLRMNTGDPEVGGNKNLFYGVTFPFEYKPTTPPFSLRDVEEELVDEAELAGSLFLKAGIAESSRFAWSLATQIYAEKFNYGKLAHAYRQLANVVSSNVPVIDTNSHALELSNPLGRFYRVWFHGGAPDEINGTEFVYRAAGSIKLDQFGEQLRDVIKGILPENTPIDLVLDDGRPERYADFRPNPRRPLGPTPIEPVKIKVTPLRPLLKRANQIRGTPEWFYSYIDVAFSDIGTSFSHVLGRGSSRRSRSRSDSVQHEYPRSHHSRSSSASVFASSGSLSSVGTLLVDDRNSIPSGSKFLSDRRERDSPGEQGLLVGVDKFSFLQPARRDRNQRDAWLKNPGHIADKSLRVTQLQVEQPFPACVARQTVMHRAVFQQSPLEAGIDAVCSWCSVLFRTAVASNGMAVLGAQEDPGIGSAAAKVVAESMYSGKVKEMGLVLLQKDAYVTEQNNGGYGMVVYDRLTEAEVAELQVKLARAIVVFMEILHLLVARNRDLLLAAMEERKRGEAMSTASGGYHNNRAPNAGRSTPDNASRQREHHRGFSNASAYSGGYMSTGETEGSRRDDASTSNLSALAKDKTDKNIAVQSEIQRTFIGMAKALHNPLTAILGDETPRWLKEICKDNYFSSSIYRRTEVEIGMADEIYFYADENLVSDPSGPGENYSPLFPVMSIDSSVISGGLDSISGSQGAMSRSGMISKRRGMSKQSTISALTGDSSIFHV